MSNISDLTGLLESKNQFDDQQLWETPEMFTTRKSQPRKSETETHHLQDLSNKSLIKWFKKLDKCAFKGPLNFGATIYSL